MIELSEEMRSRLASALTDGCPVIAASVDPDGQPKLSFYGSTHVYTGDQLAIWVRNPASGVLRRIQSNPRMAFVYRNQAAGLYWQFHGRARVVDDPQSRDKVYDGIHDIEQMLDPERGGVAVVIDLDHVSGPGVDMRRESDVSTA